MPNPAQSLSDSISNTLALANVRNAAGGGPPLPAAECDRIQQLINALQQVYAEGCAIVQPQ